MAIILGCKDNRDKNIDTTQFKIQNLNRENISILVKNDKYLFRNIKPKIVFIYFFATWCPPCIGEIPHLNSLLEKYNNQIDILGVLLYDGELKSIELKRFIKYNKIDFFISKSFRENRRFANFIALKLRLKPEFSIPLMVMFVDGKYFTHYEGIVPEEMIESDIKQAKLKLKGE